jgi:hypothetical protein
LEIQRWKQGGLDFLQCHSPPPNVVGLMANIWFAICNIIQCRGCTGACC